MSERYEEIIEGQTHARLAPGARHELICTRLHESVGAIVARIPSTRLLAPRTQVRLSPANWLRPDLALVAAAHGKLWLAAEIISSDDHRTDTVVKKELYEELRVPRLWMIDPRYDNVEIYHASEYGLALKGILAGRESFSEALLPGFQITVADLFATPQHVAARTGNGGT
jgi:Uma2 family endonuclease